MKHSEAGQLLRRALDLRAIMKAGLHLTLADIAADELYAILIIEQEQSRYDDETSKEE
jgi:hypothetical protein